MTAVQNELSLLIGSVSVAALISLLYRFRLSRLVPAPVKPARTPAARAHRR